MQTCRSATYEAFEIALYTIWITLSSLRATGADSSTLPKYPQESRVKILGVGCYFRDCESGLKKLQIRSKTCKCVRSLVNTRLMFANMLEKLKMVDMEDDLIHLMVLRRKTPGKYHSTAY